MARAEVELLPTLEAEEAAGAAEAARLVAARAEGQPPKSRPDGRAWPAGPSWT